MMKKMTHFVRLNPIKENCDCDIFQLFDPEDPASAYNFTKEINNEIGPPVYSSKEPHHLWWSVKKYSWIWNFFTLPNKTLLRY